MSAQQQLPTRDVVAGQIRERLAGRLDDTALAAWAFDRFYLLEMALGEDADSDGSLLVQALDTLMFADDPHWRLTEEELIALLAQLEQS
jgi:hypothetical protein